MRTDPVNTVRIFRTTPPSARWGQNPAYSKNKGPIVCFTACGREMRAVVDPADTAPRARATVIRVRGAREFALLLLDYGRFCRLSGRKHCTELCAEVGDGVKG